MATPIIIPSVREFRPISSERISVVIQGPVIRDRIDDRPTTDECLRSIREYLPDAEIILSTWEGADTSRLAGYDKLVTSGDPGGIWNYVKRRYSNVNRMIRSTSAGLRVASREYCLKFRTDLRLTSNMICRVDDTATQGGRYSLFSVPMTTTNYYVRDPSVIPMIFHPSDIVQFGLTRDLTEFWEQPLVDPNWLVRKKRPVMSVFGRYAGFTPMRFVPEQVVTLQWLAKRGVSVILKDIFDTSFDAYRIWEEVMLRNFRLIDADSSGVAFHSRLQRKKFFTDRANFNEVTFAKLGRERSTLQLWIRWASALFSKYVRCFFYVRYYRRLWKTYRLYRAWLRQKQEPPPA
jgi:hypothetical protein